LGHPQEDEFDSESEVDDVDVLPAHERPAACLACRTGSGLPQRSVHAYIAQGINSIYLDGEIPGYLEISEAYECAFRAAVTKSAQSGSTVEPRSFREAMAGPDADKWQHAASVEMQAHLENGTWQLVQLPAGRKAIGSKWVFKVKRNSDGSVDCYKARLVAQGFSQRPGVDFTETFAPTTRGQLYVLCLPLQLLRTWNLSPSISQMPISTVCSRMWMFI
jgi:hypothetical protein